MVWEDKITVPYSGDVVQTDNLEQVGTHHRGVERRLLPNIALSNFDVKLNFAGRRIRCAIGSAIWSPCARRPSGSDFVTRYGGGVMRGASSASIEATFRKLTPSSGGARGSRCGGRVLAQLDGQLGAREQRQLRVEWIKWGRRLLFLFLSKIWLDCKLCGVPTATFPISR